MRSMARVVYWDASRTPKVSPAMVPRNIHIRTSSFTERSFSSASAATRIGSALVISSLNPTSSAPARLLGFSAALTLTVTMLIQSITQMTIPRPISTSCLPCGPGGRISSQNATPHSGAMYRLYAQPGVVRFPDEANSARNTRGSSAYGITSSRRPWRHPGSFSQLRTGTRIWTAEASSSAASAAAPPSRGGTGLRSIAAVGNGPAGPGPGAAGPGGAAAGLPGAAIPGTAPAPHAAGGNGAAGPAARNGAPGPAVSAGAGAPGPFVADGTAPATAAAGPSAPAGAAGLPSSRAAGAAGRGGGSSRSTGPSGEASDSSTASATTSLVTSLPRRNVPARPRP